MTEQNHQFPFFTVVIPTHNRPQLLREAVDSVLAQTFEDFELLVVDDHSDTPAEETLSDYNDPRIKTLYNNRSRGGNGARNTGIFAARGEWIAFLDDDDVWLPEKLEKVHDKALSLDQSFVCIYSGRASYDFENHRILNEKRGAKLEGNVKEQALYENVFGGFSSAVVRTDIAKQAGGVDESLPAMQDKDFYFCLACVGKFAAIPESLVFLRTAGPRISTDYSKKLAGAVAFLEKHRPVLKQNLRYLHRAASVVFAFALINRNWRWIGRTLPYMVLGLFINPGNFWEMMKFPIKKRRQHHRDAIIF
ncbi:MAG: glycosyltransferase family 2 protein [bacterium]